MAVKTLDGIGRVDNATDGFGVVKVGRELLPIMLPGVDYQRVFFLSLGREFQQCLYSRRFIDGVVDGL